MHCALVRVHALPFELNRCVNTLNKEADGLKEWGASIPWFELGLKCCENFCNDRHSISLAIYVLSSFITDLQS